MLQRPLGYAFVDRWTRFLSIDVVSSLAPLFVSLTLCSSLWGGRRLSLVHSVRTAPGFPPLYVRRPSFFFSCQPPISLWCSHRHVYIARRVSFASSQFSDPFSIRSTSTSTFRFDVRLYHPDSPDVQGEVSHEQGGSFWPTTASRRTVSTSTTPPFVAVSTPVVVSSPLSSVSASLVAVPWRRRAAATHRKHLHVRKRKRWDVRVSRRDGTDDERRKRRRPKP